MGSRLSWSRSARLLMSPRRSSASLTSRTPASEVMRSSLDLTLIARLNDGSKKTGPASPNRKPPFQEWLLTICLENKAPETEFLFFPSPLMNNPGSSIEGIRVRRRSGPPDCVLLPSACHPLRLRHVLELELGGVRL